MSLVGDNIALILPVGVMPFGSAVFRYMVVAELFPSSAHTSHRTHLETMAAILGPQLFLLPQCVYHI